MREVNITLVCLTFTIMNSISLIYGFEVAEVNRNNSVLKTTTAKDSNIRSHTNLLNPEMTSSKRSSKVLGIALIAAYAIVILFGLIQMRKEIQKVSIKRTLMYFYNHLARRRRSDYNSNRIVFRLHLL